jgi:hypothetical protein
LSVLDVAKLVTVTIYSPKWSHPAIRHAQPFSHLLRAPQKSIPTLRFELAASEPSQEIYAHFLTEISLVLRYK